MLYIETTSKDAAFHFSVEEYVMGFKQPVMMIWQADKCAMIGNYQIAEAEVDMAFAKQNNIQIVRRSSGGGTIYTDLGTILLSQIMPMQEEKYVLPIVPALNKMGVPAKLEGRNDITVEGKKVSGLAQYAKYGRMCSHGSLLYDTDLDMLTRILRVDTEKITSKAIKSVRSRVTNIKEHMVMENRPVNTSGFLAQLKLELFRLQKTNSQKISEYKLSEDDLKQINQIYKKRYGSTAWTFERAPKFTFHNSKRFTGGKVEVYIDIVKGVAASCKIRGDFLGTNPITDLEGLLEGQIFKYENFKNSLSGQILQPYLGSITADELLSCIFE